MYKCSLNIFKILILSEEEHYLANINLILVDFHILFKYKMRDVPCEGNPTLQVFGGRKKSENGIVISRLQFR